MEARLHYSYITLGRYLTPPSFCFLIWKTVPRIVRFEEDNARKAQKLRRLCKAAGTSKSSVGADETAVRSNYNFSPIILYKLQNGFTKLNIKVGVVWQKKDN